jgi:hypothetical protein
MCSWSITINVLKNELVYLLLFYLHYEFSLASASTKDISYLIPSPSFDHNLF